MSDMQTWHQPQNPKTWYGACFSAVGLRAMQTDSFWTAIRDGLEVDSAGQVLPIKSSLRISESFWMTLVGSRRHAAQPAAGHMVQDTGQIGTSPSPYCRYIFYINRHTCGPILKCPERGTIMGSLPFGKKGTKAFLTPHMWRPPDWLWN